MEESGRVANLAGEMGRPVAERAGAEVGWGGREIIEGLGI